MPTSVSQARRLGLDEFADSFRIATSCCEVDMMNNAAKKNEARKKRKGKKPPAVSASSSGSNSGKGPNEAELKLLRARYQNRFNTFAAEIGQSNDPAHKINVVRVPTMRRHAAHSPIQASSPIDDGFEPTVFEQVSGGIPPARTRLRRHNIFKIPPSIKLHELSDKKMGDDLMEKAERGDKKRKKKMKKREKSIDKTVKKAEGEKTMDDKVGVPTADAAMEKPAEKAAEKQAVEKVADMVEKPADKPLEAPSPEKVAAEKPAELVEQPAEAKKTEEKGPSKPLEPEAKPAAAAVAPSEPLYGDVGPPPQPAPTPPQPTPPQSPPPTSTVSPSVSSTSVSSMETGPKISRFKGKKALFDSVGDEIVLDDKVLQEIATDLQKGVQFNPEVVDPSLANKLVEIKKKQENLSDADLKEMTEQPYEIDETANKVVEALTSRNVLAKVLDADELKVLSDYFSGSRPQDEKVLEVLNTALEKILERAAEFYSNEKELKSFIENRDQAKMRLLDALLSRRASFLSSLYSNAFAYANYLRDKMANAYQAAAHTYKVANVVAEQSMAAATDAVAFSKEAIGRSAAAASEAVAYSKDALGRSAVVAGEAVAYSKDALGRSAVAASEAVAYSKDKLEKSANAAREIAQKSHEFVVTARDDLTQRVATAREMGQGLLDTARSWTNFTNSSSSSAASSPAPSISGVMLAADTKKTDAKSDGPSKEEAKSAIELLSPTNKPAEKKKVENKAPPVEEKLGPIVDKSLPSLTPKNASGRGEPKSALDQNANIATAPSKDDSKPAAAAPASATLANPKQADSQVARVQEHWLVTLWNVFSTLVFLPYTFFQPPDDTRTDRTDVTNLRSSSILVDSKRKPKGKD